ncbi:hypothetical protein BIW11_09725 [Tropilaelaps mercedesae]|uniref:BTB domain-containing protein n=1 Tax=Tropilaelaps mercedesae TaxID=418985 RepID=A0A1V9XIS4_9ACAR|nr:hypothetical protein BIW11_09725 [Tropilaelaps mercedesae]
MTDAMSSLGQRLNAFRLNDGQLCDIELVACDSDVGVKCHKLVLMASSDYFYNMLSSGMQESRAASISLSDCRLDVLSILVEFFYTSEPPSDISCDNVLELFSWAIRCESSALCRHCCCFVNNTLGCDNVFSVYEFAVAHDLKDLRSQCLQFMQNNFEEMVKSNPEDWLAVPRETVEEIISSDYLRVCSEDTILLQLLQWTERHPEHRDILAHTRTNYLSKQILDDYKDLLEEVGAPAVQQIPRRYSTQHLHVILQSNWDLSKLFIICSCDDSQQLFRTAELPFDSVERDEDFRIAYCSTLSDGTLWSICNNQHLYRYSFNTRKMVHHKTIRRDTLIVHMAPIQDVLYSIVRLQSGGSVKLEMFLSSLFRWRTFLSLDSDAHRIVPTNTDCMYILGREGSLARVNPTKKITRPECLCANPEADWLDCEAVFLPSGQLLVHGRETEEFTTFEFDPRTLKWTLLCTHKAYMVNSYQLFMSDMEAHLAEETEKCIRVLRWTLVDAGYRWEKVCNIEHDYGRLLGPVDRYHCDRWKFSSDAPALLRQ